METMYICVYRDTIEQHDENWNLTEVEVTREFAKQWFNECVATDEDNTYESFEEFLDEYTADDTQEFYEYAIKHNAVISKENW